MAGASAQGTPSVIVSELDIIYRVYGARSSALNNAKRSFGQKLLQRRPATGVREVHAVKNVSFVANHGESIGIIGRNGSGKSTLLRAVAGLIPPTKGQVYISGEASLLGVNAVLMRQLSGYRNIMIGAQALGMSPKEAASKVDEIVEFAGIGDFIDLPMSAYSSGMAARLRFAISTAAVPDILMIDEALSTGDAAFREKSKERVAEIRERAGTVFLVSHNDTTVRSMCTRALWLDDGSLIMDGPVDDVLDAYQESRREAERQRKLAAQRRAAARKKREQAQKPTSEPGPNAPSSGTQESGETDRETPPS